MQTRLRRFRCAVFCVLCFSFTTEMAMATGTGLALSYRLSDISLSVHRVYAHGQPSQTLTIAGSGIGSLVQENAEQAFAVTGQELIDLVNELYRLRFLDLPNKLGPLQRLYLGQEGKVGVSINDLSDATTTTVCLSVGHGQKCTEYSDTQAPRELEAWVHALLAQTVRRVQAK